MLFYERTQKSMLDDLEETTKIENALASAADITALFNKIDEADRIVLESDSNFELEFQEKLLKEELESDSTDTTKIETALSSANDLVSLFDEVENETSSSSLLDRLATFDITTSGKWSMVSNDASISVSENYLNTSEANEPDVNNSFVKLTVEAQDDDGNLLKGFNAPVTIVNSKGSHAGLAAIPTVLESNPAFDNGILSLTILLDVDAGATILYTAGETMPQDIQITPDDTYLGFTIPKITVNINVI